MKKKLLLISAALISGVCGWAQTDVTSTYLDNAGFDEGPFRSKAVRTYVKDVTGKDDDGSGLMSVTSWTAGDTGDSKAGGAFEFGSNAWVAQESAKVPATNSNGEASGGALGLGGCWGGNAYYTQDLKAPLPAGTYKIEICGYNAGLATAFGSQNFGIKEKGGTTHYVSTTWTIGKWVKATLSFDLAADTEATFYVGATGVAGGSDKSAKIFVDYVKIIYGVDLTDWNNAKTAAQAALDAYDAKYATAERQAVVDAMNADNPTTGDAMTSMISDLESKVAVYANAASKDKKNDEMQDYVNNYNAMRSKYTESLSPKFADLGSKQGGQHWSGNAETWYQDQWQAADTRSKTLSVNLPAGKYCLVAAGRSSNNGKAYISVKVGSEDATTYQFPASGDTGYGIAINGKASYDWRNDTFCNGGNGRGWHWGYIEFELKEAADVQLIHGFNLNHDWASLCNLELLCDAPTKAAADLEVAKVNLTAALGSKTALTNDMYGNGVFQYSTTDGEAYNKVLSDAQDVLDNSSNLAELNAQIAAVNALALPTALNAPDVDQAYKVILKYGGWTYDNCAITACAGDRNDMGNYNVKYTAQNDNYAQALYFVAADGDNNYKIKFIDADGTERYISTGKVYDKGNDAQIRTVTNPNDALVINVRRNGQYIKLYNTAANNYIGSQDQGVFTVDSHTDMVVVETTSEKAVSRTVAPGKYSTIVLPYAVAEVSGAYSAVVNGDVVELSKVTSLEANKAYILGEGEYNFSGVSTAFKEPAANGYLTGVLTDTQVPVDAYVLQTQNEVQKFFKVVADNQPTLSANKAYLTVPASPVKEFGFAGGTATAIEALDALVSGQAKIYDLNGRQLQKLQKGVNIVNGVKVLVK